MKNVERDLLFSDRDWRPIFFENPNSKLSAKFSSTLILKMSWKNIGKCKRPSVLSERVLRENANRDNLFIFRGLLDIDKTFWHILN